MQFLEFKTAAEVIVLVVSFGGLFRLGMITFDGLTRGILPWLGQPFVFWYWKNKRSDCEVCGRSRTKPSSFYKRRPIRWICTECRLTRRGVAA